MNRVFAMATSTYKENESSLCEAADKASITNGRVLIVEDELEILELLAYSLNKEGYTVLRAEDGLTACRVIGNEKPDLILLDIMLPDLDGWEVCKLLRQHPDKSIAGVPVIMLTALDSPHDKYRGLELGADSYIPKPYAIREVILQTKNLIKRRQQTLELETRLKSINTNEQHATNLHHLLFHELRNQLMILSGYTDLLNRNPDSHRAQTCRDAIYRSSNYLQTLAEEVLLIRQVEIGELELEMEEFDIGHLIDDILRVYNAPAKERGMELIHQTENRQVFVSLNRTATKIILSSLIDNCIKYGSNSQKIKVEFNLKAKGMELTVNDQGPGIPNEDLPHIFEAYFRSSKHQYNVKGSGIGLHAVSVLANAMGGHATAENMPGKGSCFRVHFPETSRQGI